MLIRSGTLREFWGHLGVVNPPNVGAYGLSAARSHLLSLDGLERLLTLGEQIDLGQAFRCLQRLASCLQSEILKTVDLLCVCLFSCHLFRSRAQCLNYSGSYDRFLE